MIAIGLTGSIGMGKSTVAAMFAEAGIPVFDADAAVHHLQAKGGRLVDAIEAAFPGSTGPDGVDRTRLGAMVLNDPAAFARLEAIVHPAVGEERAAFLVRHADAPMVVFDIPLLFETGGETRVDTVVVVSAPESIQRARVLARPGMSVEKLDSIHARQMPDAEKVARADFVVPTGGSHEDTRRAVHAIIACLAARDVPL
ncbi:dephospho-CoA kinase [Sphingomonas sp. BE270]|jgi:dephospho-CoA kinase|nr:MULTISPECIES: dephospho-CoA kinase [unclassified Sphingomonas]MDR6848246.1 dephospho-CoA kinase [Sphingomonas sp. BE137]MDR7258908.1 dephospho-CoA kinase [Sphingomonas sp. BE270]RUN75105.1 dephospho-CoA kinase [Sphingomonas sp. TF3]